MARRRLHSRHGHALGPDLPTNGDDIAAGQRDWPIQQPSVRTRHSTRRPDPNYSARITSSTAHSCSISFCDGIGLTGGLVPAPFLQPREYGQSRRRSGRSTTRRFKLPNPLGNGEPITVYNLNRNKQGQVDLLDTNSDINTTLYTGFEVSFTSRFQQVESVWRVDGNRNVMVTCDTDNPNSYRFCDQSGALAAVERRALTIPFRHDFKLNGYYIGFRGTCRRTSPGRTTPVPRAPSTIRCRPRLFVSVGGRTQAVTVPLVSPGVRYLSRWNQLDLGIYEEPEV